MSVFDGSVSSRPNQELTAWLRKKRKMKGHSMRSLADVYGVAHTFVGKIEKNERRLDVVEFVRYCNGMNIDPREGLLIVMKEENINGICFTETKQQPTTNAAEQDAGELSAGAAGTAGTNATERNAA